MLSESTVLRTRKAIEKSYEFKADIFENKKVVVSSITKFEDVLSYSNICCRLSYSNLNHNSENEANAKVEQIIKLFVAPELEIKPGSKIVVYGYGRATTYKSSGKPAVYPTHQEVLLELLEDKA